MAEFEPAVTKVLQHEGGYTPGLPGDPGGETNFGISKRAYPGLDIKALTRDQASRIYYEDYWLPLALDSVLNQRLADGMLDCAVNCGVGMARKLAQGLAADEGAADIFAFRRISHYASLPDFHRFGVAWVRRALDY